MMKMREPENKEWYEIAYEEFKDSEAYIGVDPSMLPLGSMKARKKFFEEKKSKIQWKEIHQNLIDEIWGENQP